MCSKNELANYLAKNEIRIIVKTVKPYSKGFMTTISFLPVSGDNPYEIIIKHKHKEDIVTTGTLANLKGWLSFEESRKEATTSLSIMPQKDTSSFCLSSVKMHVSYVLVLNPVEHELMPKKEFLGAPKFTAEVDSPKRRHISKKSQAWKKPIITRKLKEGSKVVSVK